MRRDALMDAHLFRLFWSAAQNLLPGARIGKIQEPLPALLTIDIFSFGKKRQLCWHFGRQNSFCFLSEERFASGRPPSGQIMQIRKYFADRRIASALVQFCQRKLWLLPGSGQKEEWKKAPWICLDLVAGPSLHFLDGGSTPEADEPDWPSPDLLDDALANWRNWPVLTPALRKELHKLPPMDRLALLEDLKMGGGCLFLQTKDIDGKKRIVSASAWPIGASEEAFCEEEPGDGTLLDAFARAGHALTLDRLYSRKEEEQAAPARKKALRLEKLLQKLDADKKRLKSMLAREEEAQAIAGALWQIDSSAHLARIELPFAGATREIALDQRLSVLENMERFFHNAKRGKRGLAMLAKRRAETESEIAALHGQTPDQSAAAQKQRQADAKTDSDRFRLTGIQQNLPRNVQASLSSDGYVLLCGRDAKGNNAARRIASPHDLWAHVETGPGAHVIIRRAHAGHVVPDRTLDEAGALAARKSWLSDAPQANVMYAEVRHVHPDRKGPPGKVIIDRVAMTRTVALQKKDG